MKYTLVTLIIIITGQSIKCELPILVQLLCRHGDRSPGEFFPNNENKDKWTEGEFQLTKEGKEQVYENGEDFRELWYPGFLDENFHPEEIEVFSSEYDRTIQSAVAFFSGLYPEASNEEIEMWKDLINVIPKEDDYYLFLGKCPKLKEEEKKFRDSEKYKQEMSQHEFFLTQICELAGYSTDECDIQTLIFIEDNIVVDELHNFPLPEWISDSVWTRLRNILERDRMMTDKDPKLNFLKGGGGALLGRMVENIQKKVSNRMTQKLIFYSAHDWTVSAFLAGLGISVERYPSYASCAFLELYHQQKSNRMSASAELAAKLEKRNKINEGELAPTMIEKIGDKSEKLSATDELAAKLEKRTKINDGELAPTMIDDVVEDEHKTGASNELAAKLEKRNRINEGQLAPTMNDKGISIYSENPNLSRRTIQQLDEKFKQVATHKATLNLEELKKLFEGLGCPQTHLTLKGLLREAGKDANTGEVTFREFLAVFRKASSEDIDEDSPLKQLAALNEIDVGEKGVVGAKEFFQAKMKASENSSFAREVEQEKLKKAQEEEDAKNKQEAFNEIKSKFCTA